MTTAAPLVSILTPTYNHENFIGPCIESVLQQTYSHWEQIILDDGSTDDTWEIVRNYLDPRLRSSKNAHRGIEGLAHTYNEALMKSNGELIAILEGDDLWPADKLSVLVRAFSNPNIVLAYGTVRDCSPDGVPSRRISTSMRQRQRLPNKVLFNVPRGSTAIYMARADAIDLIAESTVVIRRTALEQIGGFQYVPGLCVASYPTFLKLSLVGEFYFTPQIMGFRRRHPGSASIRNASTIVAGVERYAREFLRQLPGRLPDSEIARIDESWQRIVHSFEFTAGRVSLVEKRWKDARAHFAQALSPRLPRIFLASLVGWVLANLHCDLERSIGLFGKARLSTGALADPRPRQRRSDQ
jgi:glycosyltransferase involved in cell wall biosynthesis